MATVGNYDRSVVGSTDEDHENQQNASAEADESTIIIYTCNPCKESNSVKEAFHYCPECEEFYCHDCVRFHQRMAKLKDHKIYGKSDADKWGKKATSAQLNEKCTKHPTDTISIICEACNELCCHVCISLNHQDCYKKEYIPTVAKGITQSKKLKKIKERLQTVCNKADRYKSRNENSIQDLNIQQATFLQLIADMRKQVNDVFDDMEERATLGVTHFGNTLHVNIKEEIDTCKAIRQEMDPLVKKLENTDNKDECQVFMDVVKAENCVENVKKEMDNLLVSDGGTQVVDGLNFTPNTNLYNLPQEIKSFGQVSCSYTIQRSLADCNYDDCHLDSYIEGICQLNDGTFILADSARFCLTWLSQTYKVKGKTVLDEAPSAVCNTEAKHVAVSLNKKLKVYFIDKTISPDDLQDLQFSHQCCGLAYRDRKYYISDHDFTVYVYDTNGCCKKKIVTDRSRNIFSTVRNIAIGDRANKIYVTDISRGLITLDLNGKVLSTLESKETKGAYGVCVTSDGRVLVTNYLLDNVIEVDKHGQTVLQRNLIKLTDGQSPRSICYDSQNSCVLISNNHLSGQGSLSVFQL